MATKYNYDYIIIGSGPAGGTAALMAARAKKKVALIEAKYWGGCSANYRDIPYAAASKFSQLYSEAKLGTKFGLSSVNLKYNYPTAIRWRAIAAKRAGAGNKKEFEAAGIDCIHGFAHFIDQNTIAVGNRGELKAKKFIIATGTVPDNGGVSYADPAECLTPSDVMVLPKLPKVVLIVGAGASGCEAAEYLAELGAKVILLELADRILPREDAEVAEVLGKRFAKTLGIKVITGARATSVQSEKKIKKVIFLKDGREKSVKVEAVVLATGVKPATDLGLENAKVKYTNSGIKVDKSMQTSSRHIFAIGDVAATSTNISSTEKAAYDAAVAISAGVNRAKGIADYRGFVRMTDTYPKVACVGLNEDDCIRRAIKYKKDLVPLSAIPASNVNDFKDGFLKMIINREKKIIGATIVCPNADLVVQELVLAMRLETKLLDLATTPHIATSWSELIKIAARRLSSQK